MSISGSPVSPYTSGSISVSVTSAIPVGLRSRVPAKMTSCMFTPRSNRADCSPKTQEIASEMFDLPQPFGPTMAATPSPWNLSSVRSQNDLNPRICSFFSLSNLHSLCGAILELIGSSSRPPGSRWEPGRRHQSNFTCVRWGRQLRKPNILCLFGRNPIVLHSHCGDNVQHYSHFPRGEEATEPLGRDCATEEEEPREL